MKQTNTAEFIAAINMWCICSGTTLFNEGLDVVRKKRNLIVERLLHQNRALP